jgi:glycosyltransferase XagB
MTALEAAGGWDPFNVTEDADLGIRLARMGFVTDVIDSETFEEANTAFFNWMKQRRRWLKGFLQTWLVHMREPVVMFRELGLHGFAVVQCMTIGIFASALLHPLLLAYSLWTLAPSRLQVSLDAPVTALLAGSTATFLFLGYGVAMAASVQGLKRLGTPVRMSTLLSLPVYWLMMSAAAWLALWDFIVRPFHWHKTQHGISKFAVQRQTAP